MRWGSGWAKGRVTVMGSGSEKEMATEKVSAMAMESAMAMATLAVTEWVTELVTALQQPEETRRVAMPGPEAGSCEARNVSRPQMVSH